MRTAATVLVSLGLLATACGHKETASADKKTDDVKPAPALKCPPGNAVKDGACIAVTTPEQIAAVGAQQNRLDELAKYLDQIDTVAAPIELLDGFRQLDQWKALKAKSEKLAALDAIGGELDAAVKTLRAFKASLSEASARIGNLKGELEHLMTDTNAAVRLEDERAKISAQLRTTVEPLAQQVENTLQNALVPLTTKLSDASDMLVMGCTMSKLSGGGSDQMKDLCARAKDGFAKAVVYLGELKAKPALMFTDVTAQLQSQLGQLVDVETQKLVAAAQVKVNQLTGAPAGSATK